MALATSVTRLREWTSLLTAEARTDSISHALLYVSTPDLVEEKARYALHERMLQQIHDAIAHRHLQVIGPVEQLLADEGVSESDAKAAVEAVIRDAQIDDAFRIAALFALRFPESPYLGTLSTSFTPEMRLALGWMQQQRRVAAPSSSSVESWLARLFGAEADASVAVFYRHQPMLARILDGVRGGSLDARAYPSARPGRPVPAAPSSYALPLLPKPAAVF